MKISNEDFSVWTELTKKNSILDNLESKIENRIDYVIRKIYEIYGHRVAWWDHPGHGDRGEGGLLKDAISKDEVNFAAEIVHSKNSRDVVALIKEGEWGFENSFPKRWLFEDFEEELRAGIESFQNLQKERAEERLRKKNQLMSKKQQLIESAKLKLTKEELKALRKS